jgi:threonine/homoserine/homoserine lactone efflux protein
VSIGSHKSWRRHQFLLDPTGETGFVEPRPVARSPGRPVAEETPLPPHAAWPVDPAVLPPFLIAVALIELTPGPNMGWLALVSLERGRSAGFAAVIGVTVGLAAWMLAAAFGLTELLMLWPPAYQAIRWAGVLFLLWLGWEAWRGGGDPAAADGAGLRSRRGLFLRGMTGNLLNPKAAVFYVALLPGFMRLDHGSPLSQALVLGGLHLAVAAGVHSLIVLGAAGARGPVMRRMQGPRLRAAMALGIAAVAAWMAWETRV